MCLTLLNILEVSGVIAKITCDFPQSLHARTEKCPYNKRRIYKSFLIKIQQLLYPLDAITNYVFNEAFLVNIKY